jgi:hypothetical protein
MNDSGDMLLDRLREAVGHARGKKDRIRETIVMVTIPIGSMSPPFAAASASAVQNSPPGSGLT